MQIFENPFKKSLLCEAMRSPDKEIKELVPIAREKQAVTTSKIVLLVEKIWHLFKYYCFTSYREAFNSAVKKIELYQSQTGSDVKTDMLNTLGSKVASRVQEAFSALFSDCDSYFQSWNCGSDGNYTLEFTSPLNLKIPADSATLQFDKVVTGNLSSQTINFSAGLTASEPGVAGNPYIFWMSYTGSDDTLSVRGGYHDYWPFAKTVDTPAATMIDHWKNHQIV